MKVSVALITYNHEKFIAESIDSVLKQEVDFDYEIVIGEDSSTDATRRIVTDYQKKHPEKIRSLLREKNLGMNRNFAETLQACSGEYIALLDGDDYWSSPHKLQKQVDFLENHPECVMCFHDVTVLFEDGKQEAWRHLSSKSKEFFTVEDVLKGNFIPTGSALFRTGLVQKFPEWFYGLRLGDWPLFFFLAQHGKIGFINELMGVYRIHAAAAWSAKSKILRTDAVGKTYEHFEEYVSGHSDLARNKNIMNILAGRYFDLAYFYEANGYLVQAKHYALKCLRLYFFLHGTLRRPLAKILMKLYLPELYRLRLKLLCHEVVLRKT